jgi:4-hydroxythreonine-4-phosphate dehydrogenase
VSLPIAITPGDPQGVGPEVAAAAFSRLVGVGALQSDDVVFLGDAGLWSRAADLVGLSASERSSMRRIDSDPAADPEHGHLPEIAAIATAVRGIQSGRFGALCTGPIHKGDLMAAGFPFPGHTPYLAHLCSMEPDEAVMLFAGGALRVVLATVHVPLAQVPQILDVQCIVRAARAGISLLQRGLGIERPRVAVCGLNPHAGEGGVLGHEEERIVGPAIAALQSEDADVTGPHPADTLFAAAARGDHDLVVALYHDQGLIPVKTLDFGKSVNVTAGLPIVRTSVDHGTARDIAWTGAADPRHMESALRMALRLR